MGAAKRTTHHDDQVKFIPGVFQTTFPGIDFSAHGADTVI